METTKNKSSRDFTLNSQKFNFLFLLVSSMERVTEMANCDRKDSQQPWDDKD
jgi:hypothetical protein